MSDITQVKIFGVVGAGQMGGGIAQVAAQSGFEVLLSDANLELAQKGREKIAKGLDKLVEKGKLDAAEKARIVERIRAVSGTGDLGPADIVVEAATENYDLKIKILAACDAAMKAGAILATNTSSISITKLAAATKRPELVAGMHFMNPVPVMKLCEIVRGVQSSDATVATVTELAK